MDATECACLKQAKPVAAGKRIEAGPLSPPGLPLVAPITKETLKTESATVYYCAPGARSHDNTRLAKVARLCDALNLKKIIKKGELTATTATCGPPGCGSWWKKSWLPAASPF